MLEDSFQQSVLPSTLWGPRVSAKHLYPWARDSVSNKTTVMSAKLSHPGGGVCTHHRHCLRLQSPRPDEISFREDKLPIWLVQGPHNFFSTQQEIPSASSQLSDSQRERHGHRFSSIVLVETATNNFLFPNSSRLNILWFLQDGDPRMSDGQITWTRKDGVNL